MEKHYVEVESRELVLRGYLELPDCVREGGCAPLLVMFHGFCGTLSEKHFLLSRLSRQVVDAGVATLRLDFGGSGESDGNFLDVTPRTEVEDGQAILSFGAGLSQVDPERMGLLGFSLGGFVAANVAACGTTRLKRLVLVSAAMATHKKMERSLGECGRALRGSLEVGRAFVSEGYALDPLRAARRVGEMGIPVSLVQGTADVAVPFQTAEAWRAELSAAGSEVELAYVEGADHAYDTPEGFAELSRAVIAAARKL